MVIGTVSERSASERGCKTEPLYGIVVVVCAFDKLTRTMRYKRSAGQPRNDNFSDRFRQLRIFAVGSSGFNISRGCASVVPMISQLRPCEYMNHLDAQAMVLT